MVMFCPNCGKDCADSNFCPNCGHRLRKTVTAKSTEDKQKELQVSGKVYCPDCLSTNVLVRESDYNSYLFLRAGAKLAVILSMLLRSIRKHEYGTEYTCSECGFQWYSNRTQLVEQHREHIREILEGNPAIMYPGINGGYWKFDMEGIVLYHPQKRFTAIPYDQIAGVDLQILSGAKQGWLTVRHVGNKRNPFPKTVDEAEKDKTTLLCNPCYIEKYYKVFFQLKAILEKNKTHGAL